MKKLVKREFHSRSKFFACLLTFCAGFVDAYTFMERGGTLVAGQTGNVVFLSVELIHHKTGEIEVKLATMLAFMLGIFLITVFRPIFEQSLWRVTSISPLVLICTLVGSMPNTVPNMFIVPPIAFCMGVVATAFGEVDGIVYNNSFMTGNIKKTMVAFGNFVRTSEKPYLKEGIFFVALLGSFITGAIISTYLIQFYALRTIWIVAVILFAFMMFRLTQYVRRSR
ncbi:MULTISPECIES: YoaK family protein [unclassified Streptococcus]|uniref:YoaK family protein n=1 Tax=unclassified Streptococcus TaxID=2608887 RepID=UPI0007805FBC|nr:MULTISPECIES: YoaK family protein [unclassified Streptococcus]